MARPTGQQVYDTLAAVNCSPFIKDYVIGPISVTGRCELRMVAHVLRVDKRFHEGALHRLHADVGKHRTDFRSFKGEVCPGSLQVVVDLKSGRFYADIDGWNPYQDLVNWVGHTFGEVIIPKLRGKKSNGDVANA